MADVAAHVGRQPVVKISKAAAHYISDVDEGDGEYENEPCELCTYFERIEADHCSRVRGVIAKEGHCKLWEKK